MIRVSLEPCFVLHSRPYRNTSLIVELLTQQYGRIAAVARSARGPKSRYKGCLQAFVPLLASWSGRGDLMQLGTVELHAMPYQLNGNALMSGFYLNELLMRLLPQQDNYAQVFADYQQTLYSLTKHADLQQSLRRFEKQLLASLGYGLPFDRDHYGRPIEAQALYELVLEQGLLPCIQSTLHNTHIFYGNSLLALHNETWHDQQTLKDAKRLMRIVLAHHLRYKPLKSRELLSRG